jgi:putative transposase
MISYLCDIAGVSRSGYYNYFSLQSQKRREQRDSVDEMVKEIILKAYYFKGRKKGCSSNQNDIRRAISDHL